MVFLPRVDCSVAVYFTQHVVSIFLPVSVAVSSKDESKIRRRSRTSPFCPPSCSSAKSDSKLFVLSHLHRLSVVSLHILINDDDGRRCKAPRSPPGARGHQYGGRLHSTWSGAEQWVYNSDKPLLHYSCTMHHVP